MKTLVNFRDIGGIKTQDGKEVVTGKLFRSGEIVNLSEEDKKEFTETYGIKTIIDFRGEQEVVERPDDTLPGVSYLNIDIMRDSKGNTSSFDDLVEATQSSKEQMEKIYYDIVTTESGRHGYKEFLETIVKDDEPIIFHCFAGKDRTGLGAALILGLLGVSEEDIKRDYLKTNEQRREANAQIVAELRAKGMTEEQLEEILVMMTVDLSYLEVARDAITENYGSLEDYVYNGLGVEPSVIAKLKQLYLK